MEALFAINNSHLPTPSFSVQYLLDCDSTNYGCGGGWMTDAYLWTID
jgi:C1A family cysteine protease